MALQLFADDSGNEPQDPIFVLAGFIAPYESWAVFSDQWKAAITKSPGLAYFKMAQAEGLLEEFSESKGWNAISRDERLIELSELIASAAMVRVHASIRHSDFIRWIKILKTPSRNTVQDNPYFLLFHALIRLSSVVNAETQPDEKCDFFFDNHGTIGEDAIFHWDKFARIPALKERDDGDVPNLLAAYADNPPIFRDEKCFVPLQAADLYAWQLRRKFIEREPNSTREPLKILERIEPRGFDFDEETIRVIAHDIVDAREEFLRTRPGTRLFGPGEARRRPFRKGG